MSLCNMNQNIVLGCFVSIIFLVLKTGKGSDGTEESSHPKKDISTDQIFMFSGYVLLVVAVFLGISLWLCKKGKKNNQKKNQSPKSRGGVNKKVAALEESDFVNSISVSTDFIIKTSANVPPETSSEFSSEIEAPSSHALVVLTSPEVNGLRFEDLLKSPAELIGRGKSGSLYKVMCENPRMILAVKRIKDWEISSHDFKTRMQRLDQVKHPNVLPAMAFYSSSQEKLLVFEYQNNGSLLRRLQGAQNGEAFEWSSRLNAAATIAETLAFMHNELKHDGVPHGNLKSSNILLTQNMDPLISEYGLKPASSSEEENEFADFKDDVYGFGVILLEMLTGKVVTKNNNETDLASWVVSVLREEWTVEVFDMGLIREGANEERMVNLLQVAVKCVNRKPTARPAMNQVATMINALREEEQMSMDNVSVSVCD